MLAINCLLGSVESSGILTRTEGPRFGGGPDIVALR
jgi:hypothetical protein